MSTNPDPLTSSWERIDQILFDELVDNTDLQMMEMLLIEWEQDQEAAAQRSRRRKRKRTNCPQTRNWSVKKKREKKQIQSSKRNNNNNNNNGEQNPQTTTQWPPKLWEFLSKTRQNAPLIQCITNWGSMDLMSNTLLAAGASPAMIHSAEEIADFTPQVHALCINVGSLAAASLPAMKSAAIFAGQCTKPWVLDPVAAGSSRFRLWACLELLALKPTVVRGNGSEIIALSHATGATKGVDSLHQSVDALTAAKLLARASGAIVAVSGAVDIITDGQRVIGVHNGVPMMQKITSTGCSVSALIAAFVAVGPTHAFEATASALSVFGIAGELGMGTAKGPASLRINLIDSLYGLDEATLHRHAKVSP